jgi:DNA polymerase (family X)
MNTNDEIADIFEQVANLLEIQGDNPFRIRAYRHAALTIRDLPSDLTSFIHEGNDLTMLPGIGQDLADKILEITKTGELTMLKDLRHKIPISLNELMSVPGLGAKRIKQLYEKLDVKNLNELERAAKNGKIEQLEGLGAKTQEAILRGIKQIRSRGGRQLLVTVEHMVDPLVKYLEKDKLVQKIVVAGSFRRRKDTIGDVDILVIGEDAVKIIDYFVKYEGVKEIIAKGNTKSSIMLRSGFQVDLRVVLKESYGAALFYFTGSKEHGVVIRKIAMQKGLKINEYGVFKRKKNIASKTEEEVYAAVGLPYIEPELRENRGEIEAALHKKLPKLIILQDIKGDLHSHTNKTDGTNTLEEMAKAAESKGYEYLGITDHSKHLTVAHGLDVKEVVEQIKQIDKLNHKLKNITVLKSIEVDILEDGSLDLPDTLLKELDYTVGSLHHKFKLTKQQQTERVIRAMDNRYFNIFGHPTGRILREREPYELDIEQILQAAKERGCILELNSHPNRLDLNDIYCKMAKDLGVKIAISTDAHSIESLEHMRYGVNQARRGWLEKEDVVNTFSITKLRSCFKR